MYFNPLSFSSVFVSKLFISAYDDNAEEKTNLHSTKIL